MRQILADYTLVEYGIYPRYRINIPAPNHLYGLAKKTTTMSMIKPVMLSAFVLNALLPATVAYAGGNDLTPVALRSSVSGAVINGTGAVLMSGRFGGAWGLRVGYLAGDAHLESGAPHLLAGVDRVWTTNKWHYGIGAVWIDNDNDINGTRWNFDLNVAYDLSHRFFVEYLHFSHGSKVFGIKRDLPNLGWNFIGFGITL